MVCASGQRISPPPEIASDGPNLARMKKLPVYSVYGSPVTYAKTTGTAMPAAARCPQTDKIVGPSACATGAGEPGATAAQSAGPALPALSIWPAGLCRY